MTPRRLIPRHPPRLRHEVDLKAALPSEGILPLGPGLRPFVTSNVFEGYDAPSRTPPPRAARSGGPLPLLAVFAGGRVRSLLRPRKGFSTTTTWRSLTSPRLASFPRHPKRPIVSIPSPGVRNAQVNPIRAGSLYRGLRPFRVS